MASIAEASIQRIDLEHANAKRRWEQMGKPEYLSAAMVAELEAVSNLRKDAQAFRAEGGGLTYRRDDAAAIRRRNTNCDISCDGRALARLSDDALVDRLQRGAFAYFETIQMPKTGLSRTRRATDRRAALPSSDLPFPAIPSRSKTAGCRAKPPPR